MSKLRERIYKDFKMEQLGYDFLGYTFESKKELSTHHILPRHSGGKSVKNNLCILNRYSSHNYIHLIEDYDYKTFLQLSRCLMEQVKLGKISIGEINTINEILCSFEYQYRDAEAKHGGILIKPEYKKRILTKEDL